MNLIVSSDLGRDPDDFFAICYLIASGVNIVALDISPGDPDQISFATWLLNEVQLDIPIGVSKLGRDKQSSGGIYYELLRKHGRSPLAGKCDRLGKDVIKEAFVAYPKACLFIIGPPTSPGLFFEENLEKRIAHMTMQGGFLGYAHNPYIDRIVKLEKFENKDTCATFNMNGDVRGTHTLLSANIASRHFVGKHLCHTFTFDRGLIDLMEKPRCRAAELFVEGLNLYFAKHKEKALHDLLGAIAFKHPYLIGNWVRGTPYRANGGWGTKVNHDTDNLVLASYDKEIVTRYLTEWR